VDRPLLDAGVGAHLLELAHEGTGIDPGVALRDDDVVGGDLAGVDRCRRLRGLQLAVHRERVLVGADEADLAGDVIDEGLDALVDLLQRTDEQRVPADPELGRPVERAAHLLELAGGDAGDVDDADRVVGLD